MKNEVKTTSPSGMATMPDYLKGMDGAGNEQVTRQELTVPRLVLLQQMSPELDPSSPAYLEDAKPGMILNTLTKDLFQEVNVINCYFSKEYGVWRRRDEGGGFKGVFPTMDEAVAVVEIQLDSEKFEIIEQQAHYCILLSPEGVPIGEACAALTSTKLKVSRAWNSLIQVTAKGGPRFSGVWKLSSVPEKNAKGSYHNFKVTPVGWASANVIPDAVALYEAVKSGIKTVAAEEEHPAAFDEGAY